MKSFGKLLAAAIIGLSVAQVPSFAGEDDTDGDFGTRYSVGVDKKIKKGLHVFADEEMRLGDNFSIDRMYTTAGISYKPFSWLKVGAEYSAINVSKTDAQGVEFWDWRHRIAADVTGMYKTGGWKFSLKEKFQATHKTREVFEMEKPQNALALKSRAKVSYDFKRIGLQPYAAFEHKLTLNGAKWDENSADDFHFKDSEFLGDKDVYTSRIRTEVGLDWTVSRSSAICLYGKFDNITDKDIDVKKTKQILKKPITTSERNFTIIGISYTFSF